VIPSSSGRGGERQPTYRMAVVGPIGIMRALVQATLPERGRAAQAARIDRAATFYSVSRASCRPHAGRQPIVAEGGRRCQIVEG